MRWSLILMMKSLAIIPTVASAATISHETFGSTNDIIRIEGEILPTDLETFRQFSLKYPKAVVLLKSDGGQINPAIEIGKIIKIRGYPTAVDDGDVCASACALIWIAGSKRLLSSTASLGFHASYWTVKGKSVESGVGNALVGNYLTALGASAKTVVFATTAPPDKILWLTAANKEAAGIEFTYYPAAQQAESRASTPSKIASSTSPRPATVTGPPPAPVNPNYNPLRVVKTESPQLAAGIDSNRNPIPAKWKWSVDTTSPWVWITKSEAGNQFYINQTTFKKYSYAGSGWEFWVKTEFPKDKSTKTIYSMAFFQISCDEKSYRIESSTDYNKLGQVIESASNKSYSTNPHEQIIPDSIAAALFRTVCP